jgi:hypothetical protein
VRFTFIQPLSFAGDWRRLGLTDEDLQALENEIMTRPDAGAVMRGTGGLRKMRFAPPSWRVGKRGAARVCYVAFVSLSKVYLLTVFPKNEKANLTPAERTHMRQWIARLHDQAVRDR